MLAYPWRSRWTDALTRHQYAYCVNGASVVHAEDQPSHSSLVLYETPTAHAAAAANRVIQPPRPPGISECMANYLSNEHAVAAAAGMVVWVTVDTCSYACVN